MGKAFQPKDTGKLTNEEYGTKKDRRREEALTSNGTVPIKNLKK
ncbi:hypothetical protein SAMN04487944_105117 [Gracilibacillus ureilyticus]|uniref:Uncharacterized protein n=1 Tax=Gracilibacillus ureilyticus TaxID=531814 RepID=A0A1H9PRB9_9BACI|nr:hypothetical protein [Gracilibacillus ureilyticus]SER50781.1 hypothetical protein SAMN04487944_105117 [Gracilibacillus ureilyticus]